MLKDLSELMALYNNDSQVIKVEYSYGIQTYTMIITKQDVPNL